MSQPLSLIPTPLATTVWDWLAVLDSAIQSNSDDNEAVAKAKYDKRQCQKKVQKDQKVAEEAVAWERAEAEHQEREVAELHRQEEAEHQEREENECQEKEENKCWEREVNKHREWEVQAWVASQIEGGGLQSCDPEVGSLMPAESNPVPAEGSQSQGGPQADHVTCAQCTRAEVDCTYELAKASKCGKKSCDQCLSMKEQCMPASTKKVWKHVVPAESTSLRASEKKKHAWAKSPEVEVVGGSSQAEKGKSVACDTLITSGLYAIATMIDWHTKEMAQLQQMVKMLGSSHHHMIKSMVELFARDDISRAGVAC
ncbi:hypothetical protein EDD16DRAFT_1716307 [Pisolithus croceorrhizus]|nr:hypothetical protein EV401DRAFT_2081901 [Pisolithus croceorrhizus]KAI6101985.1 hypothetical protein EDD16DRAFT_1716307 [Pisolithus croceorrhizus]KAI6168836.1 hypothetical protein EDD17DRAFT_1749168 [Pisolithus thermaeus]